MALSKTKSRERLGYGARYGTRDRKVAGIAICGPNEGTETVKEITSFLERAVDGTEFELKVSRRRETTLLHREPNSLSMSTKLDTNLLGRVASGQLQETYEDGTWRSGEWGERLNIKPIYGDGIGVQSTSSLRELLKDYVDSGGGHVGHALVDLVDGSPCKHTPGSGFSSEEKVSTLDDFRDYLTVAAAILGADRVAAQVAAWIDGEPLHYRGMGLLVGVRLDEPLTLDSGVRIERLATRSGKLPETLPGFGSEAPENYLGGVVLSVDCEAAPALFKPRNRRDGHWDFWNDVRHSWVLEGSSINEFCESLSLSYGGCIRCKEVWRDYGELREFSELSSRGREPASILEDSLPQAFLTQFEFEEAWKLHRQRIDRKANDGIGTAIGRWVNSKRPEATLRDRFIDLRIVLEALYLDGDSGSEKAFRIATYGAWYGAEEIEPRGRIHQALKKAYNVSSRAVHAGEVKDSVANQELLKTVQSLCRTAIIKRLADEERPNWTKIILGG